MLVFERVGRFEDFFRDMVFGDGTSPYKMVKCKSKTMGVAEWVDDAVLLPEEIEYFSYSFFTYYAKDLDGFSIGRFSPKERTLSISPAYINDDSAVLHEMIHLHEFVIASLPLFFHDAILFCLYRDLKSKIIDLDERIEAHGHILHSNQIAEQGGPHDILFLLKSFDLDLKMGYRLGTVFGYGMADEKTHREAVRSYIKPTELDTTEGENGVPGTFTGRTESN